jgi:hypothetical protein
MKFYNGLDSGQAASETWVPELVDIPLLGLALPLPLPLTLSGGVHE